MINIQDSRIIKYDGDKKSVTVYRDFEKTDLWYLVPKPQLATQEVGGVTLPSFSVTSFKTNTGSSGTLTFTVELVIDTEAYIAVKNALGPNTQFGQFSWNNSDAYLSLTLPSLKSGSQINVTPSNYGGNSATFIVDLKSADDVRAVREAFGNGTGLSTWSIQYVVTTLSQLPAVTATVTYDSSRAASYEKTVQIDRNVWGSETGRRVTVRQQLKTSDSGNVDLKWSVKPGPEFEQRVHDWAFTTLEGLVEAAADEVVRQLGENNADNFSISAVGSFKRVYSENQVIDWTITPQAFLPTFAPNVWNAVYKEVDNRRLTVAVTMLDDLKKALIQQVDVTITYPGKAGSTTLSFTTQGKTTATYDSDGAFVGGGFIDTYSYSYNVLFQDGKSFASEVHLDNTTSLNLTFTDLGYQQARFVGANIPFGADDSSVKFVLIDFTYQPNGNAKLYVDQKRIDQNAVEVTFASHTYLPSDAAYNYALTYVMNDGTFVVTRPRMVFAPSNRGLVQLVNVVAPAEFSVIVVNETDASGKEVTLPKITGVVLNGLYTDQQSSGSTQKHAFQDLKIPDQYFGSWSYDGSTESATATVEINGTVLYRDVQNVARQVTLRAVRYNPQFGAVLLMQGVQLPFTVTFDPSLVDWNTYSLVTVTAFRSNKTLRLQDPRAILPDDASKTDIQTISFQRLQTEQGEQIQPFPFYYTFTRYVGTSNEFYYSATYYLRSTNEPRYVQEAGYFDTTVILPHQAAGTTPRLLTAKLAASDLVAERADALESI